MKLLVVILTLLIMYSANLSGRLQMDRIIHPSLKKANELFNRWNIQSGTLQLFLLLLFFALAVVIVYGLLSKILFGILAFLFAIVILLFCFNDIHFSVEQSPPRILQYAIRNLFSVLFWFLILGPVGAVIYVLTDAIRQSYFSFELSTQAEKLKRLLDWVPVRLLGFSFALIGHFSAVMPYWLSEVLSGTDQNELFLTACFEHASNQEYLASKDLQLASEYLIRLIYRTLILWLVIVALIILF